MEDGAPLGKSQASEGILEKRSFLRWWGGCIPRGRHLLTCLPSPKLLEGRLLESEQIQRNRRGCAGGKDSRACWEKRLTRGWAEPGRGKSRRSLLIGQRERSRDVR